MTTLKTLISSEVARELAVTAADQGLTVNELTDRRLRAALAESVGRARVTSTQWNEAGKGLDWLTRQRTGVRTTCKSCGATVLWVVSAKNRTSMPIDPLPHAGGNLELEHVGRGLVAKVLRSPERHDGPRYRAHFVTCPHATNHRASRRLALVDTGLTCRVCEFPMDPAAAIGGFDTHPTCDQEQT